MTIDKKDMKKIELIKEEIAELENKIRELKQSMKEIAVERLCDKLGINIAVGATIEWTSKSGGFGVTKFTENGVLKGVILEFSNTTNADVYKMRVSPIKKDGTKSRNVKDIYSHEFNTIKLISS